MVAIIVVPSSKPMEGAHTTVGTSLRPMDVVVIIAETNSKLRGGAATTAVKNLKLGVEAAITDK